MAAKIIKKNEKVSPFSGLFYVMGEFYSLLVSSFSRIGCISPLVTPFFRTYLSSVAKSFKSLVIIGEACGIRCLEKGGS